jgi:molybdate transport system substrate-binding protein
VSNPDSGKITADAQAGAGTLAVYCPGAVQSLVRPLLDAYAQASGHRLKFESFTAGAILQRIADGAPGDVVITTAEAIVALADAGKLERASIRNLGSMGMGVAVRRGAEAPSITDVGSFKRAMLAATSIMYTDPTNGAQSGIHIAKVFNDLGLAETVAPRLRLRSRGRDGFKEVAQGQIEIGLGPMSEILAHNELVLVAPFPDEIQGAVSFAVAMHASSAHKTAAAALVSSLVSPAAKAKFAAAFFATD